MRGILGFSINERKSLTIADHRAFDTAASILSPEMHRYLRKPGV